MYVALNNKNQSVPLTKRSDLSLRVEQSINKCAYIGKMEIKLPESQR